MKKIIIAAALSMFAFNATYAQTPVTSNPTTTSDGNDQKDPNAEMKKQLAQQITALQNDEKMLTKQINDLQKMRPVPFEKIKALKAQLLSDEQQVSMLQKKLDGLNGSNGASRPYKDNKNATKTNRNAPNPGHTTHRINTDPSNTNNTKNVHAAPNPGSTTHKISTETPPVHPPVQDPKSAH